MTLTFDVNIHHVHRLQIGPIQHFEANEHRAEYWVRMLTVYGADGRATSIWLFSDTPHGLATDLDREAFSVAHPEPIRQTDPEAIDLLADPAEPAEVPTTELPSIPFVLPGSFPSEIPS